MFEIKDRYSSYIATRGVINDMISMTQQHFKDECDINCIISRFNTTGYLVDPTLPRRDYQYGDFSNIADYQTAMNTVIEAQAAFEALPSSVKQRFNYSPAALMEFMADSSNREEAVKLGLVKDMAALTDAPQSTVVVTGNDSE